MKRLFLLLMLVIGFIPAGTAVGQDIEIPPCTAAENEAISSVMDDYASKIAELSDLVSNLSADSISELVTMAYDLNDDWWNNGAPQMPDCALGIQAEHLIGREVDAMLITLLLLDGGHVDLAQEHVAVYDQIAAEMQDVYDQVFASATGGNSTGETPSEILYATTSANVRNCAAATTSCPPIGNLTTGQTVTVLGSETGGAVSGNDLWYEIDWNGQSGYVHSSVLTDVASSAPRDSTSSNNNAPVPTSAPQDASPAQAQSQPVQDQAVHQPAAPTQAPVPQEQPAGASCNGATTCGEMASCEQAYACLAAGQSSLDRDKDGVPCEAICGG